MLDVARESGVTVIGQVRELHRSSEWTSAEGAFEVTLAICFASSGDTIAETIRSVAAQVGCAPFELLLVSNATRDDSVRIAVEAAAGLAVRVIECESVGYDSNARNVAMLEAAGGKLLFLDADDTVEPDYVARMSAALDHQPLVTSHWEIATLNRRIFDAGDRPTVTFLPFEHNGWTFAGAGTLGMLRRVPAVVGGFRPELSYSANNEWCFRAFAFGFPIVPVEGAAIHYRLRPGYALQVKQRFKWGFYEIKSAEMAFRYGMPRRHSSIGLTRLLKAAVKARSRFDLYQLSGEFGLFSGRLAGALHSLLAAGARPGADRPARPAGEAGH